jgi:hypothetical protein
MRLQIHGDKTKTMRLKTNNREPIKLGNTPLQEVDAFTYLGSAINIEGLWGSLERKMSIQEYRR